MNEMDRAAESLANRIRNSAPDDPLLKHLEAASAEFLRSRGFDISTRAGCAGALAWLQSARAEEVFWDEEEIENAASWYIGEARIDGMIKIIRNRMREYFPGGPGKA